MELYIAARRVKHTLSSKYHVDVTRMLVGNFMSALDMPGFSISLLPLGEDVSVERLDEPTTAHAWPRIETNRVHPTTIAVEEPVQDAGPKLKKDMMTYRVIKHVCNMFIEKANYLTELDRASGDGDMGITMERGARAVLKELDDIPSELCSAIRALAVCTQQHTGGTSGVLYAIFLLKVASKVTENCNLNTWAKALKVIIILPLNISIEY